MNNILFNRTSNQVTSLNREKMIYEYEILLPFPISCSKQISESAGAQIQKVDQDSNPLYMINIQTDPITNEQSYTETTENQIPTKFETVINTYKVADPIKTTQELQDVIQPNGTTKQEEVTVPVYNTITTTSEIPIEFSNNPPIMIPEIISKTVTLENGYLNFTYDEILQAKKSAINSNNLLNIAFYDEDFAPTDNSFTYQNCSLGDGIIVVHENGFALSNPITLPKSTNLIELYLESQPNIQVSVSADNITFVDFVMNTNNNGNAKLPSKSNKIYLKITNTSSSNREVYAIGVLI